MITFSFKPIKWSTLPLIVASVRTFVVSWNEAADKKESVSTEDLEIPNNTGLKENVIIGKLIPAGTGCQGDRPQNLIVAEKAKELRDKRIARMKEVHDEEFDKLVSGSDDRDTMDSVEASVEESILQDAETADNNSMDIQSEE